MTACEIKIRKAKIEECIVLHKIINAAYRTGSGWTTEAKLVKGERITVTELQRLIEEDVDPILVAELSDVNVSHNHNSSMADGQNSVVADPIIVGCISAEASSAHPQLSLPDNSALIGLFAVDPSMQSRGIGRRLFDGILEWIRLNWPDCKTAILWVLEKRSDILDWYQRLGFQSTGKTRPFVMPDNLLVPDANFNILEKKL
jgi:GNAT superfamily N-acetyltransferase